LTPICRRVHHRRNKETLVNPRLYIGTAGLSVWHSDDLGETLHRFWGTSGMYSETRVWALASHPERPDQLLAGTDSGIYRLDIPSGKWAHLPSEMDALCIWSVARSPHDPDLVLAGTRPPAIFRSTDGAKTWERVKAPLPETCPAVLKPRVTRILFDPERGGARRDAVRTRAMHLIDSAKGSVAQLRADADDVVAHVEAPAPAGSVSPAPAKAAAV
jgi:hypothetical protein